MATGPPDSPPPTIRSSNEASAKAGASSVSRPPAYVYDPFVHAARDGWKPDCDPYGYESRAAIQGGQPTSTRPASVSWRDAIGMGDDGESVEPEAGGENSIPEEQHSGTVSYADGGKGSAWKNRRDKRERRVSGHPFLRPIHEFFDYKDGSNRKVAPTLFDNKKGRSHYERAVAAINAVHKVLELPRATVLEKTSGNLSGNPEGDAVGVYLPEASPQHRIEFDANGKWPIMTIIHEIGHLLDHHGWSNEGMPWSPDAPEFEEWRQAVDGTEAVQRLRSMVGKDTIEVPDGRGGMVDKVLDQKKVAYYLIREEMFARSYAQYIAMRAAEAGHTEVAEQLNTLLEDHTTSLYSSQWSPNDFKPVAAAIDGLLKGRGLTK